MIRIGPRFALLAAVAAAAVVAGCAVAANPPTSTPSDVPVPTLSEESSSSQSPADPASWVVDDGTIGMIALGAGFDDTLAELPGEWETVEGCDDVATWRGEEFSIWFQAGTSGGIETIVVEGDLSDPAGGPRTSEGIGLGSTRDEVRTVYPTAQEEPATVGEATYLHQSDDDPIDGSLFFELPAGNDRVQAIALTMRDEPPYEPCA